MRVTFVAASNAVFSFSPSPRIIFDSKKIPAKMTGTDTNDTSVIFQLYVNASMIPIVSVEVACKMIPILDPVACNRKLH
jgi:hypothetical protein